MNIINNLLIIMFLSLSIYILNKFKSVYSANVMDKVSRDSSCLKPLFMTWNTIFSHQSEKVKVYSLISDCKFIINLHA